MRRTVLGRLALALIPLLLWGGSASAAGLTTLLHRETSILTSLEGLVGRVARAEAARDRLLRRQDLLAYERAEATRRIKALERRARVRSRVVDRRLVSLYKLSRGRYLRLLVQAKGRRDLLLRTATLRGVLRRDLAELSVYREALAKLNRARGRLGVARRQQDILATALKARVEELAGARRDRAKLLSRLLGRRRLKQRIAGGLSRSQTALLRRVAHLRQRVRAAGGFVGRKGRLVHPVGGPIVSAFGHVKDKATGLPVLRSGVTFRPWRRVRVRAVYPGRVRVARDLAGYGKLVLLDHGAGYYTVYGFLSDLAVTAGQRVPYGAVLGRSGNDPLDGRSALYFEIRDHAQPLDPRPWFRR
ncbi:MAG: peptidoglycan DD-metalloendopeptidase family protein [Deltaproteobacteria bacterium]|nr:peptidoglycan DD-metalloendopeptidase family protein [Deltaproteobacteria bacterium]